MKKTMYPCQYPDCDARYDETLDGIVDSTGAVLTGWMFPRGTQPANVQVHDHVLNINHKVEVDK